MSWATVDVPRQGQWRVVIDQDADRDIYVSYCPMLDLYSQGTTHAQAAAITSAIGLWIEICAARGILGVGLAKRGTVH